MGLLKLAWKNLWVFPLSTLLSIILTTLGVGLIAFVILLNAQLKEQFDRNLAEIDLVIGAKGSPLQLILCNMYHVDVPTGNIDLKEAKPFLNPNHPLIKNQIPLSVGDSYRGYRIIGTDHSILELYNGELSKGTLFDEAMSVNVGSSVANKTGLKIGDTFQSTHGLLDDKNLTHEDAIQFKVTGILKESGSVLDQLIITRTESVWIVHDEHDHETESTASADSHSDDDEHDHEHDDEHDHDHEHEEELTNIPLYEQDSEEKEITAILLQFKNRNFQTLNMARNINENTNMQAAAPAIEMSKLYENIGVGTNILSSLAILIAIVSSISIFISLFNSMKERKYELALMRVMGSSKIGIALLILMEGLLIAIVGALVGILLSHISIEILSAFTEDAYRYALDGWRFIREEILVVAIAIVIGIVASLIPAFRAYRTELHQTLSRI